MTEKDRGGPRNMSEMREISDVHLACLFLLELEPKAREPITITYTVEELWLIFANLQFALSHKENTGPGTAAVWALAVEIEKLVFTSPALAETARRGWVMVERDRKKGARKMRNTEGTPKP